LWYSAACATFIFWHCFIYEASDCACSTIQFCCIFAYCIENLREFAEGRLSKKGCRVAISWQLCIIWTYLDFDLITVPILKTTFSVLRILCVSSLKTLVAIFLLLNTNYFIVVYLKKKIVAKMLKSNFSQKAVSHAMMSYIFHL